MLRAIFVALCLPIAALAASGDNGITGGGSATNRSGTITTGSTSQPVLPTNPNRVGCEIQAVGTADLWVAVDGTASNAAGSFFLPAGSLYRCGVNTIVPTGRISVWSTAAGAPFTAMEYSR